MKRILVFVLQGAMLAALAAALRPPEHYYNPLPMPNYPVGGMARHVTRGEPNDGGLWIAERPGAFD